MSLLLPFFRCEAEGASLAPIHSLKDLTPMTTDRLYYTAHIWTSGSLQPPLPPELSCHPLPDCKAGRDKSCLVVNRDSAFGRQCFPRGREGLGAACVQPARCPPHYSLHNNKCYSLKGVPKGAASSLYMQGLLACSGEGAALAFPEDEQTLLFLADLARSSFIGSTGGAGEIQVLLGLNDITGNWTAGGLYNPSEAIVSQAGISPPDFHYRYLKVPALTGLPVLAPSTIHGPPGTSLASCQLYGLTVCREEPPPPALNMDRIWDFNFTAGAVARYVCYPGYFADRDTRWGTQLAECRGQLGDWVVSEQSSLANLCVDGPSPPSALIKEARTPASLHLNGTLTFTCPQRMATRDLAATQILTCSLVPGGYAFRPAAVEACDVCLGEPKVEHATTNWQRTQTYVVGEHVLATCGRGHAFDATEKSREVSCTEAGWHVLGSCYEGSY
ncbi:hypothetical protein C7M84_002235 [Penaeus vannamei]|uniref:Sushi domain-containing protein n=1 Tax=Penaeus vannamei TaxID=6689 RepID=A0A423TRG7_PENVA|nr:hypothetical protein C7M84_002235 [Penaeus vannamei]